MCVLALSDEWSHNGREVNFQNPLDVCHTVGKRIQIQRKCAFAFSVKICPVSFIPIQIFELKTEQYQSTFYIYVYI